MRRIILASLSVAVLIMISWVAGHLLLASNGPCAQLNDAEGGVKQNTGATITYLMSIQNTGGVTDLFNLTAVDALDYIEGNQCGGNNQIWSNIEFLDADESVLDDIDTDGTPDTGWLEDGETFLFKLRFTVNNGSSQCCYHDTTVTATPTVCSGAATSVIRTHIENVGNNPFLNIIKIDGPDPVDAGGTLTYYIYVFNTGSKAAQDVIVTDDYDENALVITDDGYASSHDLVLGVLTWNETIIGANSSKTYTVIANVNCDSAGSIIDNVVDVISTDDKGAIVTSDSYVEQTTISMTIEDTTPPVIHLNGSSPMTIECGVETYSEPGAYATDNCCVTDPVSIGGDTVLDDTVGTYYVTYDVSDCAGNPAPQEIRTVNVVDTTAPVLHGCPSDITIECSDQVPSPANVTATDNCDPNPTVDFSEVSDLTGCSDTGTITRTWMATDACDNSSQCVQTITVVPHQQAHHLREARVRMPALLTQQRLHPLMQH